MDPRTATIKVSIVKLNILFSWVTLGRGHSEFMIVVVWQNWPTKPTKTYKCTQPRPPQVKVFGFHFLLKSRKPKEFLHFFFEPVIYQPSAILKTSEPMQPQTSETQFFKSFPSNPTFHFYQLDVIFMVSYWDIWQQLALSMEMKTAWPTVLLPTGTMGEQKQFL